MIIRYFIAKSISIFPAELFSRNRSGPSIAKSISILPAGLVMRNRSGPSRPRCNVGARVLKISASAILYGFRLSSRHPYYACLLSTKMFLGEIQRIALRLMLSSCVCVCVCLCVCVCVSDCVCVSRLWTPRKRFEIEASFFF